MPQMKKKEKTTFCHRPKSPTMSDTPVTSGSFEIFSSVGDDSLLELRSSFDSPSFAIFTMIAVKMKVTLSTDQWNPDVFFKNDADTKGMRECRVSNYK